MATYLESGWYDGKAGLRSEVVDGAIDVAGMLLRAGIAPGLVQQIALKVRSYVTFADPHMRGGGTIDEKAREAIIHRLTPYTTQAPELDSFMADCIEHVHGTKDLFALYLHLVHVTRMLQLLSTALVARTAAKRRSPKTSARPAPRASKKKKKKTARSKKK
jgi:hypothetical protein